jgi:hypothetical protein
MNVIQPRTQTSDYWGPDFALTESDIEQINNYFLEAERPRTATDIAHVIIDHRVAQEINDVERLLAGRTIYQPKKSYEDGDALVFPALKFAHGTVKSVRDGYNPQYGRFQVISVQINSKAREFAAALDIDHTLNAVDDEDLTSSAPADLEHLHDLYGRAVEEKVNEALADHDEFIQLGGQWFVKALMADVNVGHLHLAEAVLEINGGGPLTTDEIVPHLELDPGADEEVKRFSLNYALLQDDRFDEVAPRGSIAWFVRRLEPEGVMKTPDRLQYTSIPHDRALLSPQLLLLERELDDAQ